MEKATKPTKPKESKPPNSYLKYSSLGLQLLATIAISGLTGYWIDNYLKLKFPVFLLLFILVSFGGTIFKLYRDLEK
jgi:ATP synthase protein I